jgi:hypothetical protein
VAVDVVTRFRFGHPAAKDVLTRFHLTAGSKKDVITRFRLGQPSTVFTVGFASPLPTTVNPFDLIALTVDPSQTADTVTVTQTAGPAVTIAGTGLDRSAAAPGTLNGTSLTFHVVATKAGFATATSDYTVAVRAHGGLYRKSGAAVDLNGFTVASGTPTPPAPPTTPLFDDPATQFSSGVNFRI